MSGVADLRAFLPARDYALSQRFYTDIGFTMAWSNDEVSEFRIGGFSFLLQNRFVAGWAADFMMQLLVDDTAQWWSRLSSLDLPARYPGIMLRAPAMQPWGLRVLFVSDPSGVLWHIADRGG